MKRKVCFAGMKPFGSAMAQVVRTLTGTGEEILTVDYDDAAEAGKTQIEFQTDEEYVILLDGVSTPAAAYILECLKARQVPSASCLILAGVNVPMMVDSIYLKDDVDTLNELESSLCAEGKAGISRLF